MNNTNTTLLVRLVDQAVRTMTRYEMIYPVIKEPHIRLFPSHSIYCGQVNCYKDREELFRVGGVTYVVDLPSCRRVLVCSGPVMQCADIVMETTGATLIRNPYALVNHISNRFCTAQCFELRDRAVNNGPCNSNEHSSYYCVDDCIDGVECWVCEQCGRTIDGDFERALEVAVMDEIRIKKGSISDNWPWLGVSKEATFWTGKLAQVDIHNTKEEGRTCSYLCYKQWTELAKKRIEAPWLELKKSKQSLKQARCSVLGLLRSHRKESRPAMISLA